MKILRVSLFLILTIMLLSIGLHAQDTPYTLATPTSEDYLTTLKSIDFPDPDEEPWQTSALIAAIDHEFRLRYWDIADYNTLYEAFTLLKILIRTQAMGLNPAIDYDTWIAKLVQTWFDENYPTWQWYQHLTFDDFTLTREPYDFDADGTTEWLLTVQKGLDPREFEYRNRLLAKEQEGQLTVYPLDIFWVSAGTAYNDSWLGYPESEISVESVLGDETRQIVASDYYCDINSGTAYCESSKTIVGWDGKIPVSYARIFSRNNPSESFNEDQDVPIEFKTIWYAVDNWGCGTLTTTLFDWDANAGKYLEQVTNVPTDCTALQAEEAMWRGDFAEAARLYESFGEYVKPQQEAYAQCRKQLCDCCTQSRDVQILEYFEMRRIVAYALLGDMDKVSQDVAVYNETRPSSIFRDVELTPQALCQAAYNAFISWMPASYEPVLFPGIVGDASQYDLSNGYHSDPLLAGCDIRIFADEPTPTPTITATPFIPDPTATPDLRTYVERAVDTGNIVTAFYHDDYQAVATIYDRFYETLQPQEVFERQQWQYYYALSLELLNRPDEALAAYVALYESAPESAWGKLARVHFE